MKFVFPLLLCLIFSALVSKAQQKPTGSLKGIVVNSKDKTPLDYVSFALRNVKDSTVAFTGVTNQQGVFSAKGLAYGQYKFYAAFMGLKPIIKAVEFTADKPDIDFGKIEMEETSIGINDVLIKAELLPMLIKKDTIEFSAEAYKTQADANVEDVLKVMPGMEVDKDGNITFNGRKIEKILVDGKEFFGGDVRMATQNLPKDIVKKIQVVEKKTDDAIFKGTDDGKRENILNITLKDDKKKGFFGNASLAKGNGDLYESSLNVNRFSGNNQFTILGQSGNLSRGGFAPPMVMNESLGIFNFGGQGISKNQSAGFNLNTEWGKHAKMKNKLYLSYTYNENENFTKNITSRLNLLGANSFFNNRNTEVNTNNARHSLIGRLEFILDTTLKLQIRPSVNISNNQSNNVSVFNSFRENNAQAINNGNSRAFSDNHTPNLGGNMILNKRFKKVGRSMSFSAYLNNNNNTSDGLTMSTTIIDNNGAPTTTILDQLIDQEGLARSYNMSAEYNEPLTKKLTMRLDYGYAVREDIIRRAVYDYNTGTTRYDLYNTGLSRSFENFTKTHDAGVDFNYKPTANFSLNFNLEQNYVTLDGLNLMNNFAAKRDFFFFQPNFYLSYKITKVSTFTADGSRWTSAPSISQLQPIVDNTNPLNIITGNPLLKPYSQNYVSMRYNRFDPNSGISINISANAGYMENSIMNNTVYDPNTGIQNTVYDNVNGNYNYGLRVGGSIKSKKLGITVGPFVNFGGSKNYSFFNNLIVGSNTRNYSLGTSFNYAIGSVLQFFNVFNYGIRKMSYDYNNLPDNTFRNFSNSLNLTATLPYDLRFSLNSNTIYNTNTSLPAANKPLNTAGASMEKLMLKKELIFKLSVSDIFNNSRDINRFASDTYIQETINFGMRRYVLMSVTYRLKKFGT